MDRPRHELKYLIGPADAAVLSARLRRALDPDAHGDGEGRYAIRSLYLDDAFDSAYYDKEAGVQHRDKYRLRIYNGSDKLILLERKRKQGDLIKKDAVRVTRRLALQISSGDPAGLQNAASPLLRELFIQMRLHLLRPVVIVDYEREAYVHPAENLRVTLDRRVRSGLNSLSLFDPGIPTLEALDGGQCVLEVKYDRYLPDFIPGLISCVPAQLSAVSKYVLCRRLNLP